MSQMLHYVTNVINITVYLEKCFITQANSYIIRRKQLCWWMPSASGDIMRQGFCVTSGLIFRYVTLEAMWYMYNILSPRENYTVDRGEPTSLALLFLRKYQQKRKGLTKKLCQATITKTIPIIYFSCLLITILNAHNNVRNWLHV